MRCHALQPTIAMTPVPCPRIERIGRKHIAASILLLSLFPASISHALVPDRSLQDRKAAERSLLQGRLDDSISILQRLVGSDQTDGPSYLLLCRGLYADAQIDKAIGACEHAAHLMPQDSSAQDWLGRAYGIKADHAGPIDGFKLARKVRTAFEAAVALNPGNGAAVNDLSEYYVGAPSIVGGGLDKADALADRSISALPQQAHRIRAMAAEKRKDYATAEHEFQADVSVAKLPDAISDLGDFYRRRHQDDTAVETLKRCIAADKARGPVLVDAASILNTMHREPQLAAFALQQYLLSSAKTDDAPAPKAHVLLGQTLASMGDNAGARIEFGKALDLASNYPPAKKALEDK
jgi:tetratricopeptide (TPR) repeat protein